MASERNTTDAVLAAARASLLEVGVRRTTLADVARRAGVSRMTVYRAFSDVATVVGTLLTTQVGEIVGAAVAAAADAPTGRERLVRSVTGAVHGLGEDPLLRRVIELDPELLLPFVVDRVGSSGHLALVALEALLEGGRDDGSIAVADPVAAARVLLLIVQSFVLSARMDLGTSRESVQAEIVVLLDRYLAAA